MAKKLSPKHLGCSAIYLTRVTLFGAALLLAACNSTPEGAVVYVNKDKPADESRTPDPVSPSEGSGALNEIGHIPPAAAATTDTGFGRVKAARALAIEIIASVKEEQIPASQKEIYNFYKTNRIRLIADLANSELTEKPHDEVFETVGGEKKARGMATEARPGATIFVADNISGSDAELAAIILHQLGHHAGIGATPEQEKFLDGFAELLEQLYLSAKNSNTQQATALADPCAEQSPQDYLKRLAGTWTGELKFPDGSIANVGMVVTAEGLVQFALIGVESLAANKAATDLLLNANGKAKLLVQPDSTCSGMTGHTGSIVQATAVEGGADQTAKLATLNHAQLSGGDTTIAFDLYFNVQTGTHIFNLKKN